MFHTAIRRLALLAAVPLLGLAVPAPALAVGGMPLPPSADVPVSVVDLMSQVVTKTNQERARHGCGQLTVDQDLIKASARQSWYMARTGNFSHLGWNGSTFVERARALGYPEPAGENIAWGYGTADAVMDAWMKSPGHRENILSCGYKSIGTGVTYAADGTPYYTEVFGWE